MNKPRRMPGARACPNLRLPIAVALLVLLLAGSLALTGCASEEESTSTSPGGETSSTAGGSVQRGGVLRVGAQPPTNLDPHFATAIPEIMLSHQIYNFLVFVDENNEVVPELATSWDSPDAKVWTFELKGGVKFHGGQEMTADDVVFSFDRLRDASVGSPVVSLYENVESVTATDPTHVQFTLRTPNPEFPADVGDYHAAILCKDVRDPKTEYNGTGPFKMESYLPEDRAVLVKNPDYWETGSDNAPLPYLDEVHFIFSPDQGAQVESLRGGELEYVAGLSTELAQTVDDDETLKLLKATSNMHFVIKMRSDAGRPAADPNVRKALRLGTDHQALIDVVRPDLAVVGNGTPVGPLYRDYYLDEPPVYDPQEAQRLLAEAGESDLRITLITQNALDCPAIATVWKEQMARIGVTVEIQLVPSNVYYSEGDANWLEVDFGITDWGTRAVPVNYFQLAYTSTGQFDETHWSDPEFDSLAAQIASETDRAKRADLYKQAQRILIDRGPVIVPYMVQPVAGVSARVDGIALASDWPRTRLREARFVE